jgi:hypothetical protein
MAIVLVPNSGAKVRITAPNLRIAFILVTEIATSPVEKTERHGRLQTSEPLTNSDAEGLENRWLRGHRRFERGGAVPHHKNKGYFYVEIDRSELCHSGFDGLLSDTSGGHRYSCAPLGGGDIGPVFTRQHSIANPVYRYGRQIAQIAH